MTLRPAKRENARLVIGIAGPTGSGKTLSALLLAKGLSAGKPFAMIDTENGRGLHYADDFDFLYDELDAPFSPERYAQKLEEVAAEDPPVIVLDSGSHEHAGEGGVLDMHEEELQRMAGADWKKREAMKFSAWVKPKTLHKQFVQRLLRLRCHVIICLRAEEKIDLVKDPQTGKLTVQPKKTLAGHVGWIPICGKDLPYELTLSLVVTPDAPGVPRPIKLQEQHKPFVPLDRPLSEETGRLLGEWAQGSTSSEGNPRVADSGDEATDDEAPSGVAALGVASFPSDSPPMGAVEFKAWREELGISREDAAEAAAHLFPGKPIRELTDADRGQLRDALAQSLTEREAVKA